MPAAIAASRSNRSLCQSHPGSMRAASHPSKAMGDKPVWSRYKASKAKRAERLTDSIRRPGAEDPDGAHRRDMASRDSVMELYFVEDRHKIILRVFLAFEQRQSGRELISLLWGPLLPNPSCRLLRR